MSALVAYRSGLLTSRYRPRIGARTDATYVVGTDSKLSSSLAEPERARLILHLGSGVGRPHRAELSLTK
jgi:hypothetical protein